MAAEDVQRGLEQLHPASFAWAVVCCHGDPAEAEEVLQSAYLKVLERRARFAGRSSLKTWFFSVVRRTAVERARRRRLRQAKLLLWRRREAGAREVRADSAGPHHEAAVGERARRIRAALGRLSRRQRQVLELVFFHDLTVRQAAESMGVSAGTASLHYDRGKRRLMRLIEREERP